MAQTKRRLLVIGNGMVGHHFLERAAELGLGEAWRVSVLGEEPRLAYDRMNLSQLFDGKTAEALALATSEQYLKAGVEVLLGDRAVSIDRVGKRAASAAGRELAYDKLVLATGSYPFVPPIEGKDAPGCFVYRTIEDLEAIRAYALAGGPGVGVVVGGGLLGLEAAGALKGLGLETHVVEFMPRLMPVQVDDAGGAVLRARIEELGVRVHTGCATSRIETGADGRASGVRFQDGETLAAGLVVFSAGIRPRDELARAAGLAVGEKGGIVIDDRCVTSDPDILAVGECALFSGRIFGLVAPGYRMAEVAVATLAGRDERFSGHDMSTKLKLMGVDVASFGDAFAKTPGAQVMSFLDAPAAVYKKLILSRDGKQLLGGMLVGDASAYGSLLPLVQSQVVLPPHPEDLILPAARVGSKPAGLGADALPEAALVCNCHGVSKGAICRAIAAEKLTAVPAIKQCTKAGTGCGSCVPMLGEILKAELKKAGVAVTNRLCEHFAYSRQELFHLVRVKGHRSFDAIIAAHGTGRGCEICKPALASILASTWNEYIWKDEHIPLQDTNDRFLANMQRDGSYSVIPRVPGGEITPDQLIALGEVAKRYGLYAKITGGQRVDLFGARLEQLPHVWRDLIAAGFESGHAYGKALRTVKSCVGSTWCRYGQQDSVSMAVALENRYKGLRRPHKLKAAASGCARECAEAQGKDFGVIAADKGYTLYVCGNGGMKPQHAQVLAADLDEAQVMKYLDRFLMFYIRTADRLERTATWFGKLEGGIEYLRKVIVEDSLGICAELERDMEHVVATYQCEWKTTVEDPERLKLFRAFVNSPESDPSIVHVPLRLQHRTATWEEKAARLEEAI